MKLTPNILERLVRAAAGTHPKEIGCDECFEQLDRFAERRLAGKPTAEAMPLVEAHLKTCREEFEALLEAMRALTEI
jgi:hypothetical protein